MSANQPQAADLGTKVAGTINNVTNAGTSAVSNAQNEFNTQTAADTHNYDSGLVGSAINDPSSFVNNADQMAKLATQQTATYGGPSDLTGLSDYNNVTDAAQKATDYNTLGQTAGGRQQILRDTTPTGNYTTGQTSFDQLLLQNNPDAWNNVNQALAGTTAVGTNLDSALTASQQQSQQALATNQATANQTTTALNQGQQSFKDSVDANLTQQQQLNSFYNGLLKGDVANYSANPTTTTTTPGVFDPKSVQQTTGNTQKIFDAASAAGLTPTNFDDAAYLKANPDVAKVLQTGMFNGQKANDWWMTQPDPALAHWEQYGASEGRQAFFNNSSTTPTSMPANVQSALGITDQQSQDLLYLQNLAKSGGAPGVDLTAYLTQQNPSAALNINNTSTPDQLAKSQALAKLTGDSSYLTSAGGAPNLNSFDLAGAEAQLKAQIQNIAADATNKAQAQKILDTLNTNAANAQEQSTINAQRSAILSGAASGAAYGSTIGPWGTVIGGAIGAAVGGISSGAVHKPTGADLNPYNLAKNGLGDLRTLGKVLGSVLCTKTYQQGDLSYRDWLFSSQAGRKLLGEQTLVGYRWWATPIANRMDHNKYAKLIGQAIAKSWIAEAKYQMGYSKKRTVLGRVIWHVVKPISKVIGYFVTEQQESFNAQETI